MPDLQPNYLSEFITSTELRQRWQVSDRTISNLEKHGDLKAFRLMGKSNEKRYRASDIYAIENRMTGIGSDDSVSSLRRKSVANIVDRLTADDGNQELFNRLASDLAGHIDRNPTIEAVDAERFVMERRRQLVAEAAARPTSVVVEQRQPVTESRPTPEARQPEPVAEARRRRLAFEAFDALVTRDDRVRTLLEKTFTDKLDDPTFTDADVAPLIAAERAGYARVLSMLTHERHQKNMSTMFPTKAELDAKRPKIERARLPKVRPHDGMTVDDNLTVEEVEVSESVKPFEGFGKLDRGNEPTDDSTI